MTVMTPPASPTSDPLKILSRTPAWPPWIRGSRKWEGEAYAGRNRAAARISGAEWTIVGKTHQLDSWKHRQNGPLQQQRKAETPLFNTADLAGSGIE